MKITALLGSPRKESNTAVLMEKWLEGVSASGDVEIKRYALETLDINGCRGCDACQKGKIEYCVINDDMIPIYKSILQSEVIVIATPVYCFSMTAQMKAAVDRFYAIMAKMKGKKIVCLTTFGDEDEETSGAVNIYRSLKMFCDYIGIDFIQKYGVSTGDIPVKDNSKALSEVFDLGVEITLMK